MITIYFSESIVKTRWKNLRDSYRKLLFRMLEDPTEPSIPKWRYFANMEFIRSIVLNTKSKVNDITLNQSPDMISVKAEFTTPCDGNMDDKLSEDPLIFSMEPSTSDIKMERMEKMHSPSMDSNSSHFLEPEIDTLPEKLTGYPNDDDLQFLLSLHPHLKHCSMNKKLILRMKIEKLVNDEVYSTGNGDNSLHDS